MICPTVMYLCEKMKRRKTFHDTQKRKKKNEEKANLEPRSHPQRLDAIVVVHKDVNEGVGEHPEAERIRQERERGLKSKHKNKHKRRNKNYLPYVRPACIQLQVVMITTAW